MKPPTELFAGKTVTVGSQKVQVLVTKEENYWNFVLTHQGRAKSLLHVGSAHGWIYAQWDSLPADLRVSLERHWKQMQRNRRKG